MHQLSTAVERYYGEDFRGAPRTQGVVRALMFTGETKLNCLTSTLSNANEIAIVLGHALDSLKQADKLIRADKDARKAVVR
jgi:hypothetical protein